jgi:ferritin-like metal-binding protein YciE
MFEFNHSCWHELFHFDPNKTIMAKTEKGSNVGAGAGDSMLREFFIEELRDIYYAENHIAKTLPKMKKAATSSELQQAFENHEAMTLTQVARLEQVFKILGEKAEGKKCEAIEGITKEGEGIIKDTETGTATRDVGLIFAAQKVEHYEIATYGGLAQLAITLGEDEAANLLKQTLEEEKQTDILLTDIAENSVNYQAAGEQE